jgi:uncharacterized protein
VYGYKTIHVVVSITLPVTFEWDPGKDRSNQAKHGVSFADAQCAYFDERRVVAEDLVHSTTKEKRYFCFGIRGGGILTVRFTCRQGVIRIFGAGYWAKGKSVYEQENQIREGPDRNDKSR